MNLAKSGCHPRKAGELEGLAIHNYIVSVVSVRIAPFTVSMM